MPPDIVQLFNKICQKINFLTVLFQNIIVMYTKYAYIGLNQPITWTKKKSSIVSIMWNEKTSTKLNFSWKQTYIGVSQQVFSTHRLYLEGEQR